MEITDFGHPYSRTLPRGGLSYGSDINVEWSAKHFDQDFYLRNPDNLSERLPGFRFAPRFSGNDPAARVLGHMYELPIFQPRPPHESARVACEWSMACGYNGV